MKLTRFLMPWLVLFSVAGCAPTSPAQAPASWENLPPIVPNTIARVQVDGPNAYINGTPAATGAYVVDGDKVSTGPNTSMKLILNRGGYIQLDENTDPLIKEGFCLLIKILHGQVLFSNIQCQKVETTNLAAVANSIIHVKSTEQETQLTLLEGHVEVTTPTSARLERYQQYTAASDGTPRIVQLTPEQAVATAAWTQRYFRPRPVQKSEGVSRAQAAGIGIGVGILLDILRRGDSSSTPPAAPPPVTSPSDTTPPPAPSPEVLPADTSAPPAPSPEVQPVDTPAPPAPTPEVPPVDTPAPPAPAPEVPPVDTPAPPAPAPEVPPADTPASNTDSLPSDMPPPAAPSTDTLPSDTSPP